MSARARLALPRMTRAALGRELRVWALLAVALGCLEGGVAGVLVKTAFAGAVARGPLNFAVALISGAGMFANLAGLGFTALASGRDKVRLLMRLQLGMATALLLLAALPIRPAALPLFVLTVGAGRVLWAGVLAVRSAIWRANYPRRARAHVTGRFVTAHALLVAATALGMGALLQRDPGTFRWLYPAGAGCAVLGALQLRRLRVQGHRALRDAERQAEGARGLRESIRAFLGVARTDRAYARYLACMTLFGSGNIMLVAPLIATLSDHHGIAGRDQVWILTALPMLVLPVAIGAWARLLDRRHIIDYRAIHCWSFVAASAALCAGAIAGETAWLWAGSVLWGVATAGGELGWNLGHNDFAQGENAASATHYMGLHMTLTGLRGLLAPVLGITIHQGVEARWPGAGRWALLVPLSLTLAGTLGFAALARAKLHLRSTGAPARAPASSG